MRAILQNPTALGLPHPSIGQEALAREVQAGVRYLRQQDTSVYPLVLSLAADVADWLDEQGRPLVALELRRKRRAVEAAMGSCQSSQTLRGL